MQRTSQKEGLNSPRSAKICVAVSIAVFKCVCVFIIFAGDCLPYPLPANGERDGKSIRPNNPQKTFRGSQNSVAVFVIMRLAIIFCGFNQVGQVLVVLFNPNIKPLHVLNLWKGRKARLQKKEKEHGRNFNFMRGRIIPRARCCFVVVFHTGDKIVREIESVKDYFQID